MAENKVLEDALKDLSNVVDGIAITEPDGSPDWERRKLAATGLRKLLDNGTITQIVDDVIAEAEKEV